MTITAKIVADSISNSNRITTYELEFPRFILPEFNTHRLFSRNAQSSRAVPVKTMLSQIKQNMARPSHWGKAEPGMQAREEHDAIVNMSHSTSKLSPIRLRAKEAWIRSGQLACKTAEAFADAGYHKQIVNRLTEPYAHIKVVCTATEYDNFFWLRRHPDAQPEIQELANVMWEAMQASKPAELEVGEWHVPYYDDGRVGTDGTEIKNALMISASCAAQVSYRRLDDSIEKAEKIYRMLVAAEPPHFSPFEHQATPMPLQPSFAQVGVTHMDSRENYWSGNFRGWVQYRQILMVEKSLEPMICRKI